MRPFRGLTILAAMVVLISPVMTVAQSPTTDPLAIARILAAKYPAQPIMSYIPALSWAGSTPAIAEPYRLTSFAGAMALLAAIEIETMRRAAR